MRIGTRLLLAFIVLLTASIAVTGLITYNMTRDRILGETKAELLVVGGEMLPLLQRASVQEARQIQRFREAVLLRAGNIDSLLVVADVEGTILVSNSRILPLGQELPAQLQREQEMQQVAIGNQQYLAIALPWPQEERVLGYLYLLADISDVQAVAREIFASQLKIYLVMLAIATLGAAGLATSLTRPIVKLKKHAQSIRPGRTIPPLELNSRDELQSLADSLNELDQSLQDYNNLQHKLLQNISHELKTPLMAIQGYAEGIRDGIFSGAEADQGYEIIIKECQRLKHMVDELILLSQLETKNELYNLQSLRLEQIVASAVEKVKGIAAKKMLVLEVSIIDSPWIRADQVRLEQAILNLLSNCLRHSRTRVTLILSTQASLATLLIQDDGNGFSQKDLDHLFERFYKGPQGDAGLGLAIAKVIIDKHQGLIMASNHAQGAQYIVQFPLENN